MAPQLILHGERQLALEKTALALTGTQVVDKVRDRATLLSVVVRVVVERLVQAKAHRELLIQAVVAVVFIGRRMPVGASR